MLVSLSLLTISLAAAGTAWQDATPNAADWAEELVSQPGVLAVSGSGVRPAVVALGNENWFRKHADRHGDLIDNFLLREDVVELEKRLTELVNKAGPDVASRKLVGLAQEKLAVMGKSAVHDPIADREAEAVAEAAASAAKAAASLRELL